MCCSKAALIYRASFCGLGTSLHHHYGAWSRWLVNRDSTFLVLLGASLSSDRPFISKATCCNPFAEPRELLQDGPLLNYAAAVTLCGLDAKLDDDCTDERGWRSWLAKLGGTALDAPISSALGLLHGLHFPVQEVRSWLATQVGKEHAHAGLIDCAQPTQTAYGEIVGHLAYLSGAKEQYPALRQLGQDLGFLIYAQDAWDDWEQDRRSNQFNPLHSYLDLETRRAAVLSPMKRVFQSLCSVFDSLPLQRNRDLLHAVLIDGIGQRLSQIEGTQKPAEKESKSFFQRYKRRCDDCCSNDPCNCCDCCDCLRSCRISKGGSLCDCNPCDGDGIECCGCDCS